MERLKGADIIFMPYNYILDDAIRENTFSHLENSIVIFDEAHNIADAAEQSHSFDLSEDSLDEVIKDINKLPDFQD